MKRRARHRKKLKRRFVIRRILFVLLLVGILFGLGMCCRSCLHKAGDKKSASPSAATTATTTTTAATTPVTTTTTTTAPLAEISDPETELWNDLVSADAERQNINDLLVVGHTAYEYYGFSESVAQDYAAALNAAGEKLSGRATVYDIIVPTAIGVMLPAEIRAQVGGEEQPTAIDYMFGRMNDSVVKVPLMDTLRAHNNEYLYYHTDHHWSSRAAYYAYVAYMQQKGETPKPLSAYETTVFTGFYGTLYEATEADLREDSVTAYHPTCENSLFFEDSEGNRTDWYVIADVSNWARGSKYNTFIGGDNAFTEITNEDRTDTSAALVIKESFGNAFVPFLVDHYKKVYVVDYRYYTAMNLSDFVDTYHVSDVVFINNIGATRSGALVDDIAAFVG